MITITRAVFNKLVGGVTFRTAALGYIPYEKWFALNAATGEIWIAPVEMVREHSQRMSSNLYAVGTDEYPVYDKFSGAYLGISRDIDGEVVFPKEFFENYIKSGKRTMPDMSEYEQVAVSVDDGDV